MEKNRSRGRKEAVKGEKCFARIQNESKVTAS